MPATSTLVFCLLIGVMAGLLGALCGVGGGIIMVPAFVLALGFDHKVAVATSLAVIIPTALAATFQNVKGGFVHWPAFFITAVAAMIAAYFGATLMQSLSNQTLTRVFGIVTIAVGARMLFSKG